MSLHCGEQVILASEISHRVVMGIEGCYVCISVCVWIVVGE